MKVLFLTRYPLAGASSRYRVYQYLPQLRAMGVECDVQSFMSDELYRLSMQRGGNGRKIALTLAQTLRRLHKLLDCGGYDVIYMQRELFPFGGPVIEKWLKRRGRTLVYDYDDALFIKKPSKHNPLATLMRSGDKAVEIFRIVDLVVAGNDYLRNQAAKHGANAVTLHVAEDAERVPRRRRDEESEVLIVGWLGSPSTEKYLELIRKPLADFFAHRPQAVLRIVGGGDFRADFPVEHWNWSLQNEVKALASFDVGLMPLPNDEWSLGKSGGKARTYMAAGVPAICERIGYNIELIVPGITGYLVSGDKEWRAALEDLADNPALREEVGSAARRYVAENFSIEGQAAKLKKILEDVVRRQAPTAAAA